MIAPFFPSSGVTPHPVLDNCVIRDASDDGGLRWRGSDVMHGELDPLLQLVYMAGLGGG